MGNREVPPSVKSPWSLQADYANPRVYGWASILIGFIGLVLGIPMLLMSASPKPTVVLIGLGTVLVLAGVWMVKRAI